MINVPVCIIGCGPIGLAGALLLSRFGIETLLVERRGKLNAHPRSRFVDTNTMELLREFGVEKQVVKTGLGPDWTEYNRWFDVLSRNEYARIPSPTFHSVPRDTSPCLPVMTSQDHVEAALLGKVSADENIDLRFHTEASDLHQDESKTTLTLRNTETGVGEDVTAQYIIGADGPASTARAAIESPLEADPRPINSQDVIFEADLSKYFEGRKGALVYVTPDPMSGVIFQPLDGVRRWRCQVTVPEPELISEEAVEARIRGALGTNDPVPITITSMNLWQPTPGCTTRFSQGRIFLAGDAAHIAVPTGGLGNNTGFAGIRNLAWKLAFVLRGASPPNILDTYEEEHRPLALLRIDVGVRIFEAMLPMIIKQIAGQDIREDVEATRLYGNYDGTLMGFELTSSLIARERDAAPEVEDAVIDFVPMVRSGRRAPHVWLDRTADVSILDSFGSDYVVVTQVDAEAGWQEAVEGFRGRGFPIGIKRCEASTLAGTPYENEQAVVVRPDGIVAGHVSRDEVVEPAELLESLLPIAHNPGNRENL